MSEVSGSFDGCEEEDGEVLMAAKKKTAKVKAETVAQKAAEQKFIKLAARQAAANGRVTRITRGRERRGAREVAMRGYCDRDDAAQVAWASELRARDARTFVLSEKAAAQLETIRVNSGHIEALATLEWLIRAQIDRDERRARENAREAAEDAATPKRKRRVRAKP